MKKIILKMSRIIITFVLSGLIIFTDAQYVKAASSSVKIGSATKLPGYVAGVQFHIKPLSGGGYAYCLNSHKKTASNITQYFQYEMNAGIAYILENGYPHKKFTGSKNKDIYITQAAVWWYLDDTTGTSYLSKSFKSGGSDKYGLRQHIKKLVSGAKSAKSKGYQKPSLNAKVSSSTMTLSSDKKYYVSKAVNANAKNITGKYKVSVSSAPSGTIITNVNGSKTNTFKSDEKFLIKIPANKISADKTVTAKVKITASGTINRAYKYAPKDNKVQPVVVLQKETKSVSDTISVKATKPKAPTPTQKIPEEPVEPEKSIVSIIKLDKSTNTAIEGATLVVKDSNGNEVAKFTTTTDAYEMENLANGVYTVEELEAPDGYELSTEKVSFTITDSNRQVEVKFYNQAKNSVVSIIKLDKNTNNPIAGATLVVKDSNGNEIKKFKSSINGYTITGLSNGMYTVEELEAPEGYELSKEKETFTLDDTTKMIEVKFYNVPKDRVVTINKVDSATGKPLAGAVIVVTNDKGEEVARFTSTNDSYILKDLPDGTYTVEEVESPEGYFLNEDSQTFVIDNSHLSYQVTIKNVPKTCENGGLDEDECSVDVPNTGSSKVLLYLLGIAIISSGIGYVYKYSQEK
ncbi:MAG: Cys-Gln thioester bond-forming surface protein [Bacilli bacterium]|nr:Cys-Gln thioester bond-forming surface protein [Bacilli bacterium]